MDRFQQTNAANADLLRHGQERGQQEALLRGLGATALEDAERAHQHASSMASSRREAERQENIAQNLRRN